MYHLCCLYRDNHMWARYVNVHWHKRLRWHPPSRYNTIQRIQHLESISNDEHLSSISIGCQQIYNNNNLYYTVYFDLVSDPPVTIDHVAN